MNTVTLSDFLSNEYVDFSSYDLVRKIPSFIDGQKNSSRKVLHTLREQNINSFLKVSNLGPKVQDYTQYLHGALDGVIVNMTADYVGSGNNIPLLQGDGNFGSSFIPVPAASRYIFAKQNDIIKDIFPKEDLVLLEEQWFEGDKIEPRFYVPTLPLLAINGAEGISIGFASKILPRNPKDVIRWVVQRASGKRLTAKMVPYWNGMTCSVEAAENTGQWVLKGSIARKTKNRLMITSIPVGYSLKQYQRVLDKLVDDKVIRNYDDLSDDDVFLFDVSVDKDFSAKDDEWILSKLKLVKTVTENYTCIDENNKIRQFNTINEILEAWYQVRLQYNEKRKNYILDTLENDIRDLDMKRRFIQGVVDGAIELRNKGESEVTEMTQKYDPDLTPKVKEFMNLPMRVLTSEEIKKLSAKSRDLYKQFNEVREKTFEDILLEDVKNIEASL